MPENKLAQNFLLPELKLINAMKSSKRGIQVIVFHGGSVGPKGFLAVRDCVAVVLKPNHEELREKIVGTQGSK